MSHKAIISVLVSFFLIFVMATINLNLPGDVHAGPLPGFTPNPTPDGGGDDDDDDGDSTSPSAPDDGAEGDPPVDFVLVQMDQCDLVCLELYTSADQTNYELLAYNFDSAFDTSPNFLSLVEKSVDFEILAPVRLIHDGSGFIAEEKISTQRPNRISVPYPGKWEVFLIGSLEFVTAETVNAEGTNLAQLQTDLEDSPISMGIVEANTAQVQLIECPVVCVIEPVPTEEAPILLPQTGFGISATLILILSSFVLLGFMLLNGLLKVADPEEQ